MLDTEKFFRVSPVSLTSLLHSFDARTEKTGQRTTTFPGNSLYSAAAGRPACLQLMPVMAANDPVIGRCKTSRYWLVGQHCQAAGLWERAV